jgi:hypothetical protein
LLQQLVDRDLGAPTCASPIFSTMDFGLPVEPLLARQMIAGFLAPARPCVMPRWPPANIPPPEWVPIPINLFRAPCHCEKPRLPPEYLPCTTCRILQMPGIIQPQYPTPTSSTTFGLHSFGNGLVQVGRGRGQVGIRVRSRGRGGGGGDDGRGKRMGLGLGCGEGEGGTPHG